ncbi:MAG: ester cyclase [Actinomycetota bacterium]|nr:ester cyclase [Actinomycetota bacterium]
MTGHNSGVIRSFWDMVGQGPTRDLTRFLARDYARHSAHADINAIDFISLLIERSAAFPDLESRLLEFVEQGDRVAYRWESDGTHAAPYLGIPPTNRNVSMRGITIARIEGDLIAEEWSSWETEGVLRALNVFSI